MPTLPINLTLAGHSFPSIHLQSHASGHFPQLHRYLCWLSPLNYLRSHTRGHFFTSRTTQRKGDTES
ncbi:uncharacterized protein LOC135434357 isoform X2 [Drosophila montana]|uniref:uncharacterized protein LOC135430702 isoform X2 n=1 Tax=Drosophila montana TaxID=40370 RepID=UPI00313C5AF9